MLSALPAVASSGLVALEPDVVRPDVLGWVGGAGALAVVVCVAARRYTWAAGVVALAVALGVLAGLRLGVGPTRLAAFAAAAALVFVLAVAAGRSRELTDLLTDPYPRRLAAIAALASGVLLRATSFLGPDVAAGTLPGLPIQIGELTRYLIAGGTAVAMTELAACRRAGLRPQDQGFRAATWVLLGAGVVTLVLAKDLGPAALVALGVAAAVIHARGLRWSAVAVVVVVIALVMPLLWASATLRTRVHEIFAPGAQLHAALFAANSGGLIGPGPGRNALVAGIPAIGSDYAVAALVADLGALVVIPVLVALLLTYAALIRAAAARPDTLGTTAVTVASMLAGQACWSALGVVGVLPLTGLNQPFLGISGASLIVSAGALGLVVGSVDRAADPAGPQAPGVRAVAVAAAAGTRVVALLTVVASGMLAFGHQQITDADQTRMPRGMILTTDGHVVSRDGTNERIYPDGGLYADLGFTKWNYTHRGLDAVRADTLVCGGHLDVIDWITSLAHPVCKPADVVTTLDSRVQDAVAGALHGRTGEAVVLDTRGGGIVALYSTSSEAPGATSTARLGQSPPGSTMKIVTAAAGLLHGVDFGQAPATRFVSGDGQTLPNDDGETCPATDAATALAYSCNSVYGWVATQVGPIELERVAQTYFAADRPFALEGADAVGLATGLADLETREGGAVARAGIGQESVRSSVLGVALATSVIANAGVQPTYWPHLTAAICAGDGPEELPPQAAIGPGLPAAVAAPIYQGMRTAVDRGTARRLTVPSSVEVAAKTGTAQVAGGIDSWVTAIVDHRYVVTLVIRQPDTDAAAVLTTSPIVRSLPAIPATPNCPPDRSKNLWGR